MKFRLCLLEILTPVKQKSPLLAGFLYKYKRLEAIIQTSSNGIEICTIIRIGE
jgi:hypothetical protein